MLIINTCSLTTRGSLSRSAVVSLARSSRRHAWSEKVCLCWASTDITAWTNHSSAHVPRGQSQLTWLQLTAAHVSSRSGCTRDCRM